MNESLVGFCSLAGRRAGIGAAGGVAHMSEAPGDGIAWIKGQGFIEGTIELDIRGKDAFQQSFVGIAYHGVDDSTFEAPAPNANDWFHVKIVVTADKVKVFVNGSAVQSLEVTPIVHRPGRKIGYWVGNGSGGDWKDLHITAKK
ncbi:MAG TPA: hypothetical protein VGS79_08765 [Puia sp.]|nr:hypothetical protein [Puia sp.]